MNTLPIRVLVVDDEPDLCTLSMEFLSIPGEIEVDTAHSVIGARNALAKRFYDVIVSDYQMPGEDGIQFLKSLRSAGDNIPFILFTGKGREEVVIEALNNGADAYLQKGVTPRPMYAELEHRIRAAVRKRQAEDEIARTLSILESTMESTADGILVVDGKGGIVLFNKIFTQMWGIPKEIIASKNDNMALDYVLNQLIEPDIFIRGVRELYSVPEKSSLDILELKDGRIFERYSQPKRIGDSVSGRVWSFRDITERKRIEEALKKSEMLHRSILNASPDVITIADLEGRIKLVSPTGLIMFGYREMEEVLGHSILEYLLPEERERAMANIRSLCQGSFIGPVEYRGVRSDESLLDMEVNTDMVRGMDGRPLSLIIVIRDITERKRMERELKDSEEFHRQLMSNLSMAVVIVDPTTRIIENVNETAAAMFGASKENIEGNRCHSFLCPALESACPVCDLGKEVDNSERILLCSDGSQLPIIKTVRKINIRGQEKILECFIDISERKRMERALLESEQKFREIFNHANDAIRVHGTDERGIPGQFIDVNDVACDMLGYSREEMLRMKPSDISTGYFKPPLPQVVEALRTAGRAKFETEHRHKDGTVIPVEINTHIVDIRGEAMTIAVVRDISENRRNLNALKTANEKLNLLSSITRHDIKNQLMALRGYIALIKDQHTESCSDLYLQRAETAAERISAMIQFTKTYEDIGVKAPIWQGVGEVVEICSKQVLVGQVQVVNDIPAGLEVFADPLIEKVFYNLIDNAVRHGGRTTTIRFYVEDQNGVQRIVCQDDGYGISDETKDNLFRKSFGKDHGLGLFISREILAITGITITEMGEPGQGAKFMMAVPEGGLRGISPPKP